MLTTIASDERSTTTHRRPLRFRPSLDEARALADQGNVLPVYCELPADLETPVSVYLKLRGAGASFLLESAPTGGERWGRYSILGVWPRRIVGRGLPRRLRGNAAVDSEGPARFPKLQRR